jgi:hypothetical protein
MNKFNLKMEGANVVGSYDGNADGEASAALKLMLGEAYQELLEKGEAQMDVKVFSVKREGGKIIASLDSDKDGESVLSLELDIIEGLEEAI